MTVGIRLSPVRKLRIGPNLVMYTEEEKDETPDELTDFQKDMIKRFSFHPAKDEPTRKAHEAIRNHCLRMTSVIDAYVPPGRERSLAITKLEEVMFWANAGIARND